MSVTGLAQDDVTRMRDQLFFEGPVGILIQHVTCCSIARSTGCPAAKDSLKRGGTTRLASRVPD